MRRLNEDLTLCPAHRVAYYLITQDGTWFRWNGDGYVCLPKARIYETEHY